MPNSQITVTNVGINPTRTGIIDVLKDMGADITLENVHTSQVKPLRILQCVLRH